MRLFAAVRPPAEAVEHLDEFLSVRRDAAPWRWASADQVHLTLAFMAEVREHRLDDLLESIAAAAARRTPHLVRIAGGGAFPSAAAAKVLWAGLDVDAAGAGELDQLAAGVRTAAVRSGIEVDGRRFGPHLSVARLLRPAEVTRWIRLLDAYEGPRWRADTVSVVESHLGEGSHGRPRHEVLAEVAVGPAVDGTP